MKITIDSISYFSHLEIKLFYLHLVFNNINSFPVLICNSLLWSYRVQRTRVLSEYYLQTIKIQENQHGALWIQTWNVERIPSRLPDLKAFGQFKVGPNQTQVCGDIYIRNLVPQFNCYKLKFHLLFIQNWITKRRVSFSL